MRIDNLSPGDLVKVITISGTSLHASVIDIKGDRLQMNIIGDWESKQQDRDARKHAVRFSELVAIKRLGRAPEPNYTGTVNEPPAIKVPSYVTNFFKSLRS